MIRPLDRSVLTPPSGAAGGSTSADLGAARFEEVLAQATAASNTSEVKTEAGTVSLDGLLLQPQVLIAADDTWVEVVATVEELGNPALPQERKHMLLQSLAENWRSFQSQSQSIARLLEDYAGRESTAGRSHTASGPGGLFNIAEMPDPAKPISDF
jgi:hypothetical protein